MSERELVDKTLGGLSVLIGMIMEDEVGSAVTALPADRDRQAVRLADLGRVGRDIGALAEAAQVLLRRSADHAYPSTSEIDSAESGD